MAILSKIRERSMFLILVIGLALFAFVLDPSTITDFFNSTKINQIGEVDGEVISRQDFATAIEAYQARTGGRVSEMQAAKAVWNNLVREKIYSKQLEEAGITVGEADIMNYIYDAPSVQNDPRFQTSGIFDKAKLIEFLATIKEENSQQWQGWQRYMASVKSNLEKTTYDNLVTAGLGASLKEGETQYLTQNTKVNGDFVYVPFTSVADSLITVKKSEIQSYIDAHSSEFQVEASRDISFVKFDIVPTKEDEEAIKVEVAKLLEDAPELGTKGLKSTTDYAEFLDETKSDLPLNTMLQFKGQVPQVVANDIFDGKKGDTFGPYKDNGYFKISKITEVIEVQDSVKSSHILVPFIGSGAATKSTFKTEEQAKKTADSIFKLVKNNKIKYKEIADDINPDGTKGKGGSIGWVTYNTAFSPSFDKDFADFIFENKEGSIGVVKTKFGYHIIRVDEKKLPQNAVKLATFARKIEASEATENAIFQNAETFAQEISGGNNFDEVTKTKNLKSLPAVGLKALDDNVPGLGKERQIINWAFDKEVTVGDYKRFDVEGGYVVATLTGKTNKGLTPVEKAYAKVRPILMNKKKATIIEGKMTGATLAEIAKSAKQTVRKASLVNLKSPTITGVGYEPKVVGAMINAKENAVIKNVVGDKGVFSFKVTGKELPTTLPNYDAARKRIVNQRKNQSYQMFEAIKKASNVEDNVSSYYGIQ